MGERKDGTKGGQGQRASAKACLFLLLARKRPMGKERGIELCCNVVGTAE